MQDIMVRTNTERDSDRVGQRERETGCIAKVFGKDCEIAWRLCNLWAG